MAPTVSIIIPVGGRHAEHVGVALASCVWQTMPAWEAIVINDCPEQIGPYADPRIRVIDSPNRGIPKGEQKGNRAAMARNAGIAAAEGVFIVCLDADDYLLPQGLEILLRGHLLHDKIYTYSSMYTTTGQHMRPMDYSQEKYAEFNIHTITALIPTDAVRLVGGFDEQAPGWEDWTLYLRLAMAGQCGHYVRGPIFVYRDHLSINHFDDVAAGRALMDRVTAPYRTERGDIPMSKCCGAPSSPRAAALAAVAPLGAPIPTDAGMVTLEYVGPSSGTFIAKVPGTGRQYRIGRNATVRYVIVPPEDVDFLMMAYELVRVMPTPAPVSAPEPVVAVPPPVDVTATVEAESTATTTTTKTRTKTASS